MSQAEFVKHTLCSLETLPTLPPVAMALVKAALEEDLSVVRLIQIMELDPILSLKILGKVNGSEAKTPAGTTLLRDAVWALGPDAVRDTVLKTSTLNDFLDNREDYGINLTDLWRHSLGTAVLARELARSLDLVDPQEAFLAGLIHDVGKVVLCTSMTGFYSDVTTRANERPGISLYNVESETLGFNHAEIGGWVMEAGKVPSLYARVVLYHHHPTEEAFPDKRSYALACLIALANNLCYGQRTGSGGDPARAALPPNLYKNMGIPREAIKQALTDAPFHMEELAGRIDWQPVSLHAYRCALNPIEEVSDGGVAEREEQAAPSVLDAEEPAGDEIPLPVSGKVSSEEDVRQENEWIKRGVALQGINAIGLSLQPCHNQEAAVRVVAEGLCKSFPFSNVICSAFHSDEWEYRAEAFRDGLGRTCEVQLVERSPQGCVVPPDEAPHSWLHIDLKGKEGGLGSIKVKPAQDSEVPLEILGLLLASCAKLVAEALDRIRSGLRIGRLSEDLAHAVQRLEMEKRRARNEMFHKEDILNSLPLGLLLLDREGKIGFANPEARKYFEPGQPLKGRRIRSLLNHPEMDDGIRDALHGKTVSSQMSLLPGSLPQERPLVRWSLLPIQNGSEVIRQVLLVLQEPSKQEDPAEQPASSQRIEGMAGWAESLG